MNKEYQAISEHSKYWLSLNAQNVKTLLQSIRHLANYTFIITRTWERNVWAESSKESREGVCMSLIIKNRILQKDICAASSATCSCFQTITMNSCVYTSTFCSVYESAKNIVSYMMGGEQYLPEHETHRKAKGIETTMSFQI
jgi:hypothetical protein